MTLPNDPDQKCIRQKGRLDANTAPALEEVLTRGAEQDNELLLDLSECPYLSSAGIRVLLKAHRLLQQREGGLFLAAVLPGVMQVLETAGLDRVFCIVKDVESALHQMAPQIGRVGESLQRTWNGKMYRYEPLHQVAEAGWYWLQPGIMSHSDLGNSLSLGVLQPSPEGDAGTEELFVTTGHCYGFLAGSGEYDFRIHSDARRAALPVMEAISFGELPAGSFMLETPGKVTVADFCLATSEMSREVFRENQVTGMVLTGTIGEMPVVITTFNDIGCLKTLLQSYNLNTLAKHISSLDQGQRAGFQFSLDRAAFAAFPPVSFRQMTSLLTFDTIMMAEPVYDHSELNNPRAWLFLSGELQDGASKRLVINMPNATMLEPGREFLVRLLYTDASRVVIDPLHGGYSAQTFRVVSYDKAGRKMGPTVLKMASRNLIMRESDRCRQYALPFIFNNSAVVQGAEFLGDNGALRYNFVGIGGEESELKWLTHYYQHENLEFLEPLFDKIFLTILKPWYGQPINETIFPFRDHDPTLTFFPFIYDAVNETLSISANEQWIQIPESKQKVLNPYWFLKHEFARLRETGIPCFTGICHGDLNMQNILLDEKLNVYLIDFSETRPRSVVSDFARLEAIFMVDNAPLETDADYIEYLDFIGTFYAIERLDECPAFHYTGRHQDKIQKNTTLSLKMRRYAFDSTGGNPNPIPYFLALLEWVLPIVCYNSAPLHVRRLSMVLASGLCERVFSSGIGK